MIYRHTIFTCTKHTVNNLLKNPYNYNKFTFDIIYFLKLKVAPLLHSPIELYLTLHFPYNPNTQHHRYDRNLSMQTHKPSTK